MDLKELRAGGNTSTFDADAHCPTCRTPVPYQKGELRSSSWWRVEDVLFMRYRRQLSVRLDIGRWTHASVVILVIARCCR